MNIKPSSHPSQKAAIEKEKGPRAARPTHEALPRAVTPPEMQAQDMARLNPQPAAGEVAPSASLESLWASPGGTEIEQLTSQMEQLEVQIAETSERLDEMWEGGGADFRTQVINELKNAELTPEVKEKLEGDMAKLERLESLAGRARSEWLQGAIERLQQKVTGNVANVLEESGAKMELRQAVERTTGDAEKPFSLTKMLGKWFSFASRLRTLQGMVELSSRGREETSRRGDRILQETLQEKQQVQRTQSASQMERLRQALATLEEKRAAPEVSPAAAVKSAAVR
jgi:hypothetical protein